MDLSKIKSEIAALYHSLRAEKKAEFNRHVSFGDLLTDRWETARHLGFGEEASCYDNVLVLGDVKVGKNTWIGPNVILDGKHERLEIGDYCSISAGVQIYTHESVRWSQTLGEEPMTHAPTKIGNGVYIGPNSVISKGVTIGNHAVIGALSFVNGDVPEGAQAWGNPARVQEISGA